MRLFFVPLPKRSPEKCTTRAPKGSRVWGISERHHCQCHTEISVGANTWTYRRYITMNYSPSFVQVLPLSLPSPVLNSLKMSVEL